MGSKAGAHSFNALKEPSAVRLCYLTQMFLPCIRKALCVICKVLLFLLEFHHPRCAFGISFEYVGKLLYNLPLLIIGTKLSLFTDTLGLRCSLRASCALPHAATPLLSHAS